MSERVDQATSQPGEREEILLEHEYDGIREYDNPLPRWWVSMFWLSIVFAGLYFFHFHISRQGTSISDAYSADVAAYEEAEAKRALKEKVSEESLQKLQGNEQAVAGGAEVFRAQCVPCHGEQAQGVIGPNLTDRAWVHGRGTLMDIYEVVSTGVAAKGMPAWSRQLTPMELRQVVAFVGTLRNTMVAGKAPEGELVEGEPGKGAGEAGDAEAGPKLGTTGAAGAPDDAEGAAPQGSASPAGAAPAAASGSPVTEALAAGAGGLQ